MTNKRALIVDDSKTAQFKLKKILSGFELNIDSVFSAEDALSYLSYQAPDIIFMDHSMKGMSGLEAVKIIKLNPVTAVIPIVMYTAERGDVYVSQARAVGAMQVLSKDLMTESDIGHVMQSTNIPAKGVESASVSASQSIISKGAEKAQSVIPAATTEQATKQVDVKANLIDVRNQVSRAIELQHGKIQRDIQDSSRMITRRLMYEVNELHAALKQQNKKPSISIETFADLVEGIEPPKQRSILWTILPLLGLLGLMAYGIYELQALKSDNRSLINANQEFAVALAEQNQQIVLSVEALESQTIDKQLEINQGMDESIAQLANLDPYYDFGELAINAKRAGLLSNLLNLLDQTDFNGVISVDIYAGNFCVITDAQGQFTLPANEEAVLGDCQFIQNYIPDPSRISNFSIEFSRLLNTHAVLTKGNIDIVVDTQSVYAEIEPFFIYDSGIVAREWNEIAAKNNKVVISLEQY